MSDRSPTGTDEPAVSAREVLYGWEPRTRYVPTVELSRGQAKALIARDEGEAFTDLRCRRVWLSYREVTEGEAEGYWFDDWYPGYEAWLGCKPTDPGAIAWWEVTWPRD